MVVSKEDLLPKTYREMFRALQQMNDEQLDSTITVYYSQEDEYHPAEFRVVDDSQDVLDKDHPIIYVP